MIALFFVVLMIGALASALIFEFDEGTILVAALALLLFVFISGAITFNDTENLCELEGYDKTTDWKVDDCGDKIIIRAECDDDIIIPFERTEVCAEVDKWGECIETEYKYEKAWESCKG